LQVSVTVNDVVEKRFHALGNTLETFTDHSFSLQHLDRVTVELVATNRLGAIFM
jgi:hypothetical protein